MKFYVIPPFPAKVLAIRQKTPIGATFMTIVVISIIISLNWEKIGDNICFFSKLSQNDPNKQRKNNDLILTLPQLLIAFYIFCFLTITQLLLKKQENPESIALRIKYLRIPFLLNCRFLPVFLKAQPPFP